MRAHPLSEGQAPSVDVRGDHLRRAGGPCDPHCEAADGSAPHHEHGAARNVRGEHRVKRVAHRIHDRSHGRRDAVERQHVGRGHHDVVGEGAVPIDADDARVATDMAVAGAALQTVPAHDVPLGGHELTSLEFGHPVAQGDDLPSELVAHDDGRRDPALRPGVPVGDVQVRAADTGVAHRDQHFPRTDGRLRYGDDFQARGPCWFDDRLHGVETLEQRDDGRGTRQNSEREQPPSVWSTAAVI